MPEENRKDDLVLVSRRSGIMLVTFNRADKKNALNHAMYESLNAALEDARQDGSVRVLCFRGSGGCFTSGNDLKDFLMNPPTGEDSPVLRFIAGLAEFPKPLAALVEGPAIGIGATMLLHCDMVFAADNATFQMPFTKLALCPEAGSSFLLPLVVGLTRATALLTSSQTIDASTAASWGLITEVFHGSEFEAEAFKRLDALAALPPEAVRTAKALVRGPLLGQIRDAVRQEAEHFQQRLMSPEAAEAMQAFLERRAPDFSRFS